MLPSFYGGSVPSTSHLRLSSELAFFALVEAGFVAAYTEADMASVHCVSSIEATSELPLPLPKNGYRI